MAESIATQIKALQKMTVPELQAKYRELFGDETRSHHKQQLYRKLAWRIQELAEGGLSERAKARAREIANVADIRIVPPRRFLKDDRHEVATPLPSPPPLHDTRLPAPGAILEREYKGNTIHVTVLEKGFQYDGRMYRSLSAIAREITGTNWNGMAFFGLSKKRSAT